MTVLLEHVTPPNKFPAACPDCPAGSLCAGSIMQTPKMKELQEASAIHRVTVVQECHPIPASATSSMETRVLADFAGDGIPQIIEKTTQVVPCAGLEAHHAANSDAPTHDLLLF